MHNQAALAAEATLLEGIDAFCGIYWDPAIWEVSTIPILSKCYQHTTLVWFPTIILLFILAPILVAQTFYTRPNPIPWTRRFQLKIGLSSILVADSLTLFSIVIYEMIFVGTPPPVDFVYPMVQCVAMITLTTLIVSCRNYGIVSSGCIFISWIMLTLSAIPKVLYWIHNISSSEESWEWQDYPKCVAVFIWFGCCLLETWLHCYADIAPVGYKILNAPRKQRPKMTSSCLNRITMWWFTSLCRFVFRSRWRYRICTR